jgi:hypothetical protein
MMRYQACIQLATCTHRMHGRLCHEHCSICTYVPLTPLFAARDLQVAILVVGRCRFKSRQPGTDWRPSGLLLVRSVSKTLGMQTRHPSNAYTIHPGPHTVTSSWLMRYFELGKLGCFVRRHLPGVGVYVTCPEVAVAEMRAARFMALPR